MRIHESLLVLTMAAGLLVAAAPRTAEAQPFDHLKCFKVKDPGTFKSASLRIIDDLEDISGCTIKKKAKQFCIPVEKTVTSIEDGMDTPVPLQDQQFDRLCYKMKCTATARTGFNITDQFGTRDFEKPKISEICMPAFKGAPPTTTTTVGPTTTTTMPGPGVVLQGVLPQTNGRFNFGGTLGIPGSDIECNANFAGSHTCTFAELLNAEAAGDLAGVKDTGGTTVTSFWAIDAAQPAVDQCLVTIAWDYATAHTGQFADRSTLNNPAGTLGAIQSGQVCATQSWVGCCL